MKKSFNFSIDFETGCIAFFVICGIGCAIIFGGLGWLIADGLAHKFFYVGDPPTSGYVMFGPDGRTVTPGFWTRHKELYRAEDCYLVYPADPDWIVKEAGRQIAAIHFDVKWMTGEDEAYLKAIARAKGRDEFLKENARISETYWSPEIARQVLGEIRCVLTTPGKIDPTGGGWGMNNIFWWYEVNTRKAIENFGLTGHARLDYGALWDLHGSKEKTDTPLVPADR